MLASFGHPLGSWLGSELAGAGSRATCVGSTAGLLGSSDELRASSDVLKSLASSSGLSAAVASPWTPASESASAAACPAGSSAWSCAFSRFCRRPLTY